MSELGNKRVALSVRNAGISYSRKGKLAVGESHWPFRGISFDVYRSETLGVIGRNGAGKSSLLRALGGIISFDEGEVVFHTGRASLLALRVGFLDYLSGRENAVISGMLQGMRRKDMLERLPDIINFSGLADSINDPVGTYSSGMRARLGFSVAIQTIPDLLLIDESLGVGDEEFRRKSNEAIRNIIASDRTVIFVSHSVSAVVELCDRVLWLENGKIQMEGKAELVMREYVKCIQQSQGR